MNWLKKLLGLPFDHVCMYRKQDVMAHAFASTELGKRTGGGMEVPSPRCIHCGKPLDYPPLPQLGEQLKEKT